ATEAALAEIWQNVLGVDRVSTDDDFFALGGHSLLAAQVAVRVRDRFRVELPLREVFDQPTVANLSARIESAHEEPVRLQPIPRAPRDQPLRLSVAQERLWFLDQIEPGSAFYNIPGAIRLTGALNVSALESALRELVRRHETLRTTFDIRDGRPIQ